jgi:hypothetical protein
MFIQLFKLFVTLAACAVMLIMPAAAQFFGPDLATPTGGYGPGFSESVTWSGGAGTSANTDSFVNNVVSPFGGPFFGAGFGPCGFGGFGGPIGGLAQNALGNNIGEQSSTMGTFSRTTSFGLGQPVELVFGIPVPGPAGLLYC